MIAVSSKIFYIDIENIIFILFYREITITRLRTDNAERISRFSEKLLNFIFILYPICIIYIVVYIACFGKTKLIESYFLMWLSVYFCFVLVLSVFVFYCIYFVLCGHSKSYFTLCIY